MDMKAAIKISAQVTGNQEVDRLRRSMGGLESTVGTLKKALGVLGVGFTVQQFGGWIKGAVDAADALNDLSQRTGVAVEDLDALSLVAEQNGTTIDAVSGSISKLAKAMGDAAGGSASAQSTLRQFGIGIDEIRSGSITATEALARIAERIASMPDGLQKAAAAQRIFGKSASEIIPFLNAGGDAIRESRQQLESYGALLTGESAKAADDFNDQMALLSKLSDAAAIEIGKSLLPAVNEFIAALLDFVRVSGGVQNALANLPDVLGFGDFWRNTKREIDAIRPYFEWLDEVVAKYGPYSNGGRKKDWDVQGLLTQVDKALAPPKPKQGAGFSFDFGAGDAAEKANRELEKRARLLESQNAAIDDFILGEQETIDLLRLEGQAVGMSAFEFEQLVEAKRHEYEVASATNDMLPETAARYKQVADALFATRQEVERFNYEQSRAFGTGAKQAFQEYADNASDLASQANNLVSDAFGGMEDALAQFVQTGKLDFSELIDSMIADLARLALRQAILGPLAQALGGVFGGTSAAAAAAGTGTASAGLGSTAAQGALFGEASAPFVASASNTAAPTKSQGANVQVVVNNHSGQQVATTETTDGRGNRRVEVTVGDLVASEIRRPGSSANLAIRQSFGARQTLTGR